MTPFPEHGGRPATPATESAVIVSQEQAPQPPGPSREVCERFPEGPCRILTGVRTQWPALEEHKIQMLQELAEATCSPEEATATRWENRNVREEVRE
jgi:hypothetical protein